MPEFDGEAVDFPIRKPTLQEVKQALHNESAAPHSIVPSTVVYGLSDLTDEDARDVLTVWDKLPAAVRRRVLLALNEASEAMFELNFREIALLGIEDSSSHVRSTAIELLWVDESLTTMRKLLSAAKSDPDTAVRARALESLGRFILLGEYEEVPIELAAEAQALTYEIHTDRTEPLELRRRALEALANSSHAEVSRLINAAYADGNHELKIGAIFAMGRTCNNMWQDMLIDELESGDNECVYEAIRACGQLQLRDCVGRIGEFTQSGDHELRMIAVWSLGEIGGRRAFEILSRLDDNDNDEEIAVAIDEALDAASFSLSFASLGLDLDDT